MKHAKHTPWYLRKTESYEFTIPDHGIRITFEDHIKDQDATTRNARLIAAAPELLEALESALEYLEANIDEYSESRIKVAKQALAKARGES